ncbi:epsin-3-like [Zingiber officinale]|uniref:ENTH domain-containing protein n=1 Tax=Zingiber officinale TaxID=94328 RepID=A0A8J5FJS2_ZINOF|nr:epsin-3-like [Zingiber officinale]KAG6488863.1 hypothetical protein ZIOFF_050117 [Zingiber officinale]
MIYEGLSWHIAMASPFFDELRKQASSFLKEKIRSARLALTDVTPAQLLTEEATNGGPWASDAMTMNRISRAAFEVDDYWRIVDVLHRRLTKFERRKWREAYKAVIVLEHLLTHGPESASEEFQQDRDTMEEMSKFQYVDEKGFNWGLSVKNKTERVLKLLEKGPLLKQERARARQISRGIQGFGSFNLSSFSIQANQETSSTFDRINSTYEGNAQRKEEMNPESDIENKRLITDVELKNGDETEEGNEALMFEKEVHPFSRLEQESVSLLLMTQ